MSLKVYALALRYLMALVNVATKDSVYEKDLLDAFATIIAHMELEAKK